uniref:Ataxin-10 n=1 Tax=Tetraodon nigroviridis TaxID=99883 RepID=H3BVQ0_TETNG
TKSISNLISPQSSWSRCMLLASGDSSSPSPAVGFKAQLIRLIGNLCHKHPNNQKKVGELEGIPLILDNCRIDSNNPFICQWAIFAIRNLLENNEQNQEVVASLERQGRADCSSLRELGFQVEERDGSLLLQPA